MAEIARKAKGILVQTPNDTGTLGKISETIAKEGINIIALCGFVCEDKGNFAIVTDNNAEVLKRIKEHEYEAYETDVVLVDLENKPGTLAPVAKKLGDSGIDIDCVYCTSCSSEQCGKALAVFLTKDNDKAVQHINS